MTWTTTPNLNPKQAFVAARNGAARRKIDWRLSFSAWWELWEPFWDRKRYGERLAMARHWDRGGYVIGNVAVVTVGENNKEGILVRRLIAKGQITNK